MTTIKQLFQMNNKQVEPTMATIKYTLETLYEVRKTIQYLIDQDGIDNKIAELEKVVFGMTYMDELNKDDTQSIA
jgi:hypothetical protein